jgi:hypothetical protein
MVIFVFPKLGDSLMREENESWVKGEPNMERSPKTSQFG